MAVMSTKMVMKKNTKTMSDLRKRATELLSRNYTRHPQESEIQMFIEKEIDRIAEERVREHQEVRAAEASRAGVIRTR